MSIGLVMIVRDEAAILPRLAASLQGHIDHYTLVDTGSGDDTVAVAEECFAPLPGVVESRPWENFAANRNQALALAEPHTDWLLVLDADETLEGEIGDLPDDSVDAVCVETRFANLRYWLPRLIRSGRGFRYRGRAHEYLEIPGAVPRQGRSTAWWIVHHADGGGRGDKYHRDLDLLLADWEEHHDARSAFYLARTYDDVGSPEAVRWYRRRLDMGGFPEEVFYSVYRLGVCLLRTGDAEEGCGYLWRAWGLRPHRAEPLVALAEHYRLGEEWNLAWLAVHTAFRHTEETNSTDLFADADALWRITYEGSIAAWYVGERDSGRNCIDALQSRDLPEPYRSSVVENATFYQEQNS